MYHGVDETRRFVARSFLGVAKSFELSLVILDGGRTGELREWALVERDTALRKRMSLLTRYSFALACLEKLRSL